MVASCPAANAVPAAILESIPPIGIPPGLSSGSVYPLGGGATGGTTEDTVDTLDRKASTFLVVLVGFKDVPGLVTITPST